MAVGIASSAAEKSRALGFVTGCAAAAAAAAASAGASSPSSSLEAAAQHIASQLESLTSKHPPQHDSKQQQQHVPAGSPSSAHLREVCLQAAAAVVLLSRQEVRVTSEGDVRGSMREGEGVGVGRKEGRMRK